MGGDCCRQRPSNQCVLIRLAQASEQANDSLGALVHRLDAQGALQVLAVQPAAAGRSGGSSSRGRGIGGGCSQGRMQRQTSRVCTHPRGSAARPAPAPASRQAQAQAQSRPACVGGWARPGTALPVPERRDVLGRVVRGREVGLGVFAMQRQADPAHSKQGAKFYSRGAAHKHNADAAEQGDFSSTATRCSTAMQYRHRHQTAPPFSLVIHAGSLLLGLVVAQVGDLAVHQDASLGGRGWGAQWYGWWWEGTGGGAAGGRGGGQEHSEAAGRGWSAAQESAMHP